MTDPVTSDDDRGSADGNGGLVPSAALKRLEEQLTCSICSSRYTDPKTLPCLHSFCLSCLQQSWLELQPDTCLLECPICQRSVELPNQKMDNLPPAVFINNLLEIQRKVSANTSVPCTNCHDKPAANYCKQCTTCLCASCTAQHNDWKHFSAHSIINIQDVALATSQLLPLKHQGHASTCSEHALSLDVFCETCEKLVCKECCTVQHKDHTFEFVADNFTEQKQEIEDSLALVKKRVSTTKEFLTALIQREDDISKQGDRVLKEIHTLGQWVSDLIQQSEKQLAGQVGVVVQHKRQFVASQREEAEQLLVQLQSCEEFVEQGFQIGNPKQIVSEKQRMMDRIKLVCEQSHPDVLKPVEEADIKFTGNKQLLDSCGKLGDMCASYASVVAKVTVPVAMTERKTSCVLTLDTKEGGSFQFPSSLLLCTLVTEDPPHSITCSVEESKEGEYDVCFMPLHRGSHLLTVSVGGSAVSGNPFPLHVLPSPETRGKPTKIISNVSKPYGLAVTEREELVVVENGKHRITMVNRDGKKIRSFGSEGILKGCFMEPRGVALTSDGHILVTDEHRLQKLTVTGECVCYVGGATKGNGPLELNGPTGVAVHPTTNQIYVADTSNHRIQVINNDFTHARSFGKHGSSRGHLSNPYDVAITEDGRVFVTNTGNHCIDIFSPEGKFLRRFGKQGSEKGQLLFPSSITIDDHNYVYVTEYDNHCISIFDTEGQFLKHFGNKGGKLDEFNCPRGVATDNHGNLYVSDFINDRLIIL